MPCPSAENREGDKGTRPITVRNDEALDQHVLTIQWAFKLMLMFFRPYIKIFLEKKSRIISLKWLSVQTTVNHVPMIRILLLTPMKKISSDFKELLKSHFFYLITLSLLNPNKHFQDMSSRDDSMDEALLGKA